MKTIRLALLLHLILLLLPALAEGYSWPLVPWDNDPVHGVEATLGEFRPPWDIEDDCHFHKGIDLEAPAFTPVYSASRGRVRDKGNTWVRISDKIYRHVFRFNRYLKDFLKGDKEVPENHHIADVKRIRRRGVDLSHLHFEDLYLTGPVLENPLADGNLVTAPDFDTLWPKVIDIWFQRNNTDTCLPEQNDTTIVRGRIDIVARARDEMPDPGSENVGLYRMAYLVRDRDGNLVSDTVESCRFDTVPNQDQIFHCYQKVITFSDGSQDSTHLGFRRGQQYIPTRFYYITTWRNGSQYDYWNTKQREGAAEDVDADSVGEAKYPDNMYRVSVLAWDIAGHGGDEEDARGADTAWVVVDNFLPELRELTMKQGRRVIYNSDHPDNPDSSYGFVQPGFPLDFTVCFSEGMPTDSPPIVTYGPPNDADTVTTVGWDTTRFPCDTWIGTAVPDYSLEGDHQVHILVPC